MTTGRHGKPKKHRVRNTLVITGVFLFGVICGAPWQHTVTRVPGPVRTVMVVTPAKIITVPATTKVTKIYITDDGGPWRILKVVTSP